MSDDEDGAKKISEREIFGISGPVHLTYVDWRLPEHRKCIAASLVQGTYTMERDRQQNRTGPNALAPIWWQFFHFRCIQILVDVDSSIFGAIFEYYKHSLYPRQPQNSVPPRYVIAFRGTLTKPDTRKRDLYLDLQLPLNGLTRNTRYRVAIQAVQDITSKVGPTCVWLAGHSLGAAIALQVGKEMAKRQFYLETYLFNPPYSSPPIETLNHQKLKHGIRIASSFATAGLSQLLKGGNNNSSHQQYHCDTFTMISTWIPYLFVNPSDPICCEYIGYFENREKMEGMGMGGIERIATQNTMVSLLSGALGKDGEASHLLPSAFVTMNVCPIEQDLKLSHGIHQWWKQHPYWNFKLYRFR